MITRQEVMACAKAPLTDQQIDAIIGIMKDVKLKREHLEAVVRIVEEMNL